jgi:MraZ protein
MAQIFLGNELMKVDQKGRVGIPARFMTVLRSLCPDQTESVGLMVTPEQSIKIMPLPAFLEEVERWSHLSDLNADERMLRNMATGSAELAQLDRQNRIKLNPLMMELCEIRQQVVIVGSMEYMQLFDVDVWKRMFRQGLGRMGEAMQAIADRDKPVPTPPAIRQIVINTADIEERAHEQAEQRRRPGRGGDDPADRE